MSSEPPVQPFVSVVVAFHFGRGMLRPCVESLLSQDYPKDRYEVIFVDNGSTDGTDAIVAEYAVRLVYERELKTAYAGLNVGIRGARGEIVAITGADCVADPLWLRELARSFAAEDIIGVAGPIAPFLPTNLVGEFLELVTGRRSAVGNELLAVPTGNVAYRRRALVDVGLFSEQWPGGADIDLSWRIQARTGGRIVFNDQAVVFHRYRTEVRGLFRQFRRYGLNEMVLAAAHRGQAYHQRTLGYHLKWMLRQVGALFTYASAFLRRCLTWPWRRYTKRELLWPLLWLVAEGGSLLGKLEGLVATRFLTRNPFPSRADILR
jgi:cellulose synthase/poly-beta-1,6-N-acetylglucosamine synthase-like glycosyltransferase